MNDALDSIREWELLEIGEVPFLFPHSMYESGIKKGGHVGQPFTFHLQGNPNLQSWPILTPNLSRMCTGKILELYWVGIQLTLVCLPGYRPSWSMQAYPVFAVNKLKEQAMTASFQIHACSVFTVTLLPYWTCRFSSMLAAILITCFWDDTCRNTWRP
jgi:hypothetical protein